MKFTLLGLYHMHVVCINVLVENISLKLLVAKLMVLMIFQVKLLDLIKHS